MAHENINVRERLFFVTTRIIVPYDLGVSCGTGFFFQLNVDGKDYPLLITNAHVVGRRPVVNYQIEVHSNLSNKETISVTGAPWYFHQEEDLAFTFVNPVFEKYLFSNKKKLANTFLVEQNLLNENDLKVLDPIEDVLMVGYPRAIYDEANNLPVIRKGITASMIGKNYNGKREGLLDIAIYPGSSGSPVFVTKSYVSGQLTLKNDYIKLLGINFSGEVYSNPVVVETSGAQTVKEFINIARYVNADCILDFKSIVRQIIKTSQSDESPLP